MHQSMRKTRPRPFWTGYTTQLAPAPTIGPRLCQGHGLRNYRLQLLLRISPKALRRISPKLLRRISPKLLRRISPKLLLRISPKLLRRISHHLLCLIKRQRIFRTECPVYYENQCAPNSRRATGTDRLRQPVLSTGRPSPRPRPEVVGSGVRTVQGYL
jgi:hypothetical protein